MGKISVFLIANHQLQTGFHSALACHEDLEIQGEAGSMSVAIPMLCNFPPQSVIVCGLTPSIKWSQIYQLKLRYPSLPIVLVAEEEQEATLFKALEAGADAFITRTATSRELGDAIRQVFNGTSPITGAISSHPKIALLVLRRFLKETELVPGLSPLLAGLTAQERQVLLALAEGMSPTLEGEILRERLDLIRRKLVANRRVQETLSILSTKLVPSTIKVSRYASCVVLPPEIIWEVSSLWIFSSAL